MLIKMVKGIGKSSTEIAEIVNNIVLSSKEQQEKV